jgi:hypothetical protein
MAHERYKLAVFRLNDNESVGAIKLLKKKNIDHGAISKMNK